MSFLDTELVATPGVEPGPLPDPDAAGIEVGSPATATEAGGEETGTSIVTAQEFAAVEEAGADPLVGEPGQAIIPEGGDVMLYGDGGASKTTLSLDLAAHLAAGDDWLDVPVPAPVRVLVIEAEGPRPLFREKMRRKLEGWHGSDIGDRLLVLERPWASFRFPDGGEIADLVGQREVDVLIVGPLTRVGMEELGTLQQVRDFMAEVERFRQRSGRRLTVFLVHHENKGGKVSGAWEGAGDTLLHAEVHAQGKTTLRFQKARWASAWHKRTLELAWTAGEGFEAVSGEERDYADEIEELLRGTDKWMTLPEISTSKGGIGANKDTVREVLDANPERFPRRTGDDAKAVDRSVTAVVWQVAQGSEPPEPPTPPRPDDQARWLTGSSLKGEPVSEPASSGRPQLAQGAEPPRAGGESATPEQEADLERVAAKFGREP